MSDTQGANQGQEPATQPDEATTTDVERAAQAGHNFEQTRDFAGLTAVLGFLVAFTLNMLGG